MLRWLQEHGFDLTSIDYWEVVDKEVHASGYVKSNARVIAFIAIVVHFSVHELYHHNTGKVGFVLR